MVRKTALLAVVLALTMVGSAVTIAAVAQDQQEAGNQSDDAVDAQSQSHLRVAHAAANASVVDVTVGNETVATNVAVGEVSEYVNLSSGQHDVTITAAEGGDENATDGDAADQAGEGETVFEETVTVDDRSVNTLVIYEEDGFDTRTVQTTMVQDDAWTPESDSSAVRVVHFAPDAADVNVTLSADGGADDGAADNATSGEGVDDNATDGDETADNATDADEAGNATDAGDADNATDAEGADNATDAEDGDNATDAEGAGENETAADDAGDNETAADGGDDNATDAEDAGEDEMAADGAGDDEAGAQAQETVLAESLAFNESADYVTVQSGDEVTIDVGDGVASTDTSLDGESAYTVWVVPIEQTDTDEEPGVTDVQVIVTSDASLTPQLPDDAGETQTPAGENETETPAEEDETETPEDEGETETPADEGETPEDEGETETPEEADETETPEDEGDGAGNDEAE